MGRFTSNILILSGILLMFYLTGLIAPNDSALLSIMLHPENIGSTTFFTNLIKVVGLAGFIFLGLTQILGMTTFNLDLIVMAGFSVFMASMLLDFLIVYDNVHSELPVVALIIFAPLMIYWVMGLIEYWRGRD